MASIVEIGANALRLIGAQPITSLTDDSERARLDNALWPAVRDAVLRAHPWNFALRRVALAKLATGPAWEFTNAFQLPVDPYCLRVVRTSLDDLDVAWAVEGRTLVTNSSSVKIAYIAKIEDPGTYDASFLAAVEARLAADLAYPVTSSAALGRQMLGLYQVKINEARFLDALERSPQTTRASDLVDVRA